MTALIILAALAAVTLLALTAGSAVSRHREKRSGYKPAHRR